METTIQIGDKPLKFKASAAVPLLYRNKFGRDLMRDLSAVAKAEGDNAGAANVAMIERMAYIMAYHADSSSVPEDLAEWLSGLPPMAVYLMIPYVMALWAGNTQGLVEAQKKTAQSSASSQPLS